MRGYVFDLTGGYDLNKEADRERAWRALERCPTFASGIASGYTLFESVAIVWRAMGLSREAQVAERV